MKKTLFIISLILALLVSSGCSQTLFSKLDNLGFHDYYAVMPSGELNMKLKEKGYTLLEEYNNSKKLYINPNIKDKYIVTKFQSTNYEGFYRVGWRILSIDEQMPENWKNEY